MSTAAQIQANQLNAQASTGPNTPEGKSTSAQNATKHGLAAAYPVIRSEEERTQFETMTAAFEYEIRPATQTEMTMFKQLIHAAWNIDRCHRLEAGLSTTTATDPLLDESASKTLARIESYRTRAERLFHKSLKTLTAAPKPKRKPSYSARQQNEPNRYTSNPNGAPYIRDNPQVGRNEPCPCGSTKKYKQCCLQNEANSGQAA